MTSEAQRPSPVSPPARSPVRQGKVLGLGAKSMLLVVFLVAVTAGSLSWLLISAAQGVMLSHEMTDLSDETDLRGWEMADLVGETRLLFSLIGRKLEDYIDAPLERRDELLGEIRAEIDGWHTKPLAIEMLETVSNDGKLQLAQGARQLFAGPAESLEQNASYRLFRTHMLGISRESTQYELSNANLEYKETRFTGLGDHTRKEMFVLWIGGHIELPTENRPGMLLVMALGLDKSMIRLSSTPRHLAFVFDQDGNQLLNPLMQFEVSDREGRLNHRPTETDEPFPGLSYLQFLSQKARTSLGLSERVDAANLTGTAADDEANTLALPPERAFYYLESEELSEPLTAEETRIAQDVLDEIRIELCEEEWRRTPSHPAEIRRVGGLSSNVETLRIMGSSRDAIDSIRDEVVGRLKSAFRIAGEKLARQNLNFEFSGDPVECRVCRVRATRVNLVDPGPNSSEEASIGLLIARGVFEEEIQAALDSELRGVTASVAIVAFLIALVALYFGNRMTKPLQKMTSVAEDVSEMAHSQLTGSDREERVREITESLPLTRRDEIGILARSFRGMLDDVISGQRALEDLNRDLENRVQRRTEELQKANAELLQLARNKDEFLANVSHELRTPLNWLYGAVQFLEMSHLEEQQAADVKTIRKATEDLGELIEDILDYQKIIMDGMAIDLTTVELRPLLEDVWDSLKMYAAKYGAGLEFEFSDDLGTMQTDRKRLKQIVKNLGTNACKFKDPDGKRPNNVTVAARRKSAGLDEQIVIRIHDTGRGMKPAELEKLFHKFERHAKDVEGTGLGLVITRGLVELMGGRIDIESEYGVGTTFTVTLPAAGKVGSRTGFALPGERSGMRRSGEAAKPVAPVTSISGQQLPKVLVVDDDPNVREMMTRYLTDQGYLVVTADDGVSALSMVKHEHPDLITLDVIMPHLDGWAVLAALKTDAVTGHIPVIMMTTLDDEDRGYALGADEYLVKPVDWSHLTRVLDRYCDKQSHRQILVIDDDPQTRELFHRQLDNHGWTVKEAENGRRALDLLKSFKPDAILLDLMMPVMDGFEFILEREKRPDLLDIPVIVVTAKDPSPEELERLQGSVSRILQKGAYSQAELLSEIQRRVDRHLKRTRGEM